MYKNRLHLNTPANKRSINTKKIWYLIIKKAEKEIVNSRMNKEGEPHSVLFAVGKPSKSNTMVVKEVAS